MASSCFCLGFQLGFSALIKHAWWCLVYKSDEHTTLKPSELIYGVDLMRAKVGSLDSRKLLTSDSGPLWWFQLAKLPISKWTSSLCWSWSHSNVIPMLREMCCHALWPACQTCFIDMVKCDIVGLFWTWFKAWRNKDTELTCTVYSLWISQIGKHKIHLIEV